MRKLIFVLLVGMAFSPLIAKGDLSEGAPEGKVYSYKKEGGVAHEIEIHFPKDHVPRRWLEQRRPDLIPLSVPLLRESRARRRHSELQVGKG